MQKSDNYASGEPRHPRDPRQPRVPELRLLDSWLQVAQISLSLSWLQVAQILLRQVGHEVSEEVLDPPKKDLPRCVKRPADGGAGTSADAGAGTSASREGGGLIVRIVSLLDLRDKTRRSKAETESKLLEAGNVIGTLASLLDQNEAKHAALAASVAQAVVAQLAREKAELTARLVARMEEAEADAVASPTG